MNIEKEPLLRFIVDKVTTKVDDVKNALKAGIEFVLIVCIFFEGLS